MVSRALLLLLLLVGVAHAERRALVIGINAYQPPKGQVAKAKPPGDLTGAVNDARALRALLTQRLGFAEGHVQVLVDQSASRQAILAGLDRLIANSRPGDVVWVSYSGHGARHVFSDGQGRPTGTAEALVPADAWAGAQDILDATLRQKLNALLDRRVELVALFDSCHSGSVWRGPPAAQPGVAREVPARVLQGRPPPPGVAPETRGALVMAAAQANQLAVERSFGGTRHGAFTRAVLSAVRQAHPATPAGHLFQQIQAHLRRQGVSQVPALRASADRARRPLLGGVARARPLGVPLLEGAKAGGLVRLQAGPVLGVTAGAELRALGDATLRVRVQRAVAPLESEAQVVGPARAVPGDTRFQITRWAAPSEAPAVWVPKPARGALRLDELGLRAARTASDALWRLEAVGDRWRWRTAARALTPVVPLAAVAAQLPALLRHHRWLTLPQGRGGDGHFPYRLVLADGRGAALKGPAAVGDRVYLQLRAAHAGVRSVARRHVYVVLLDQAGHSSLLYPHRDGRDEDRALPQRLPTPARIDLGQDLYVEVQPPLGEDTYLLLTTESPLPDPNLLDSGVVGKAAPAAHPAHGLIAGLRGQARDIRPIIPPGWSVQAVPLQVVARRP